MRYGRILGALALLGWALAPLSAAAQDRPSINLPSWVTFPSDELNLTDFYPESAAVSGLGGAATIRCQLEPGHDLSRCVLLDESPKVGFGQAALAASELMTVSGAPASAMPDPRHVDIPFVFHWPAGMTLPQSAIDPRMVTNPNWKKLPSADDLAQFVPSSMTNGKVKLLCFVTLQGLMDRCRVMSEYPAGSGLGAAALHITQFFLMTPRLLDGVPTANAEVVIPVAFSNPSGQTPGPSGPTLKVLGTVIWAETPTADQVAAAFPKAMTDKVEQGHAIIRCYFRPDGTVHDCDPVVELPPGKGFGSAAVGLAKYFKANINAYGKDQLKGFAVDIPVNFAGPKAPAATEITAPVWTRALDPNAAQYVYPPQAAAAHVATGKGVVACTVNHAGALTNCQVIREEPAGLGFGAVAVQVAQVMALNPWTDQGNPVDGDSIRLPLVFKLPPADAPTKAPADAPKP